MNWADIGVVFRKEWLQTLRNRNTLYIMLVLVVLQPIAVGLIAKILEQKLTAPPTTKFELTIIGDDAPWLAEWFARDKSITIVAEPKATLKEVLPRALEKGSIVIESPPGFKTTIELPLGSKAPEPELKIFVDNRRDNFKASQQITALIRQLRFQYASKRLEAANIPDALRQPLDVSFASGASDLERSGALIGLVLPITLVMLLLTTTLYSATDLITGERERGTLMLLMVSPASRRDILFGKLLVVICLTTVAAILLTLLDVAVLHFTVHRALDAAGMFAFHVPFAAAFLSVLLILPLILALSALAIAVSSYVRNYQQAQSYFSLLVLLMMVPASAQMMATNEYPPIIAIVPIANISLCLRDLYSGQLDFSICAVTVISSIMYAATLLFMATRLFDSEHSVFPQDEPASSARGLRRVLAGYMVAVFLLYFTVGQAIQAANVLVGIIVSQALIIALPNFGFLRWMKLPVRKILGFNPPQSWRALLAAPLLAPATMAACGLIMTVQENFLPAPKALEEMMVAVMVPSGQPTWLVFVAIALTPAICEELLFRGTVQNILLKSMPPRWALSVTAIGFGLFHMSTFRVLPTSLLGGALCFFAWKQKSIYPSMLLHCCHNALSTAVVVYHLDAMSGPGLFILAASSAVAIWLLSSKKLSAI